MGHILLHFIILLYFLRFFSNIEQKHMSFRNKEIYGNLLIISEL